MTMEAVKKTDFTVKWWIQIMNFVMLRKVQWDLANNMTVPGGKIKPIQTEGIMYGILRLQIKCIADH